MRVKSTFISFFNHRAVVMGALAIVMVGVWMMASSFTRHPDRDQRARQTNLRIRQIGHQLLLQAGDTRSRVLPVGEVREGSFLLAFERDLVFNHDSLITLAQRLLPEQEYPSGYTVTVHDCSKSDIVYGFQINYSSPDIIACTGRIQPRGCYSIQITFQDFYDTGYPIENLAYSGVLLLLGIGLLIGRFGKKALPETGRESIDINTEAPDGGSVQLGKFLFDIPGQRLLKDSLVVSLTDKECRVLELLHENFGELIPRDTLLEKIWVSEGVFTGRSLDMYVSKLRKKLSHDPDLKITNVHGKGYKLERQGL
jgi:hypothetical protein